MQQERHREVRHYMELLFPKKHPFDAPPPPREWSPHPPQEHRMADQIARSGLQLTDLTLDDIRKGERLEEGPKFALYLLDGKRHFAVYRFDKDDWIVLKDPSPYIDGRFIWLGLFVGVNTLLLFFYLFLYRKLTPLHRLKAAIQRFANGEMDIDTRMHGKDEISDVANAFNGAITKIRTLQESRNLFLRNIMHELKTPIAKGKITVDMFEESKYKDRLAKSFERLEFLLHEFAKVEQVTSGYFQLKRHPFRVMDLLDHAIDLLQIDGTSLKITSDNSILEVDFELFSTALKNLIDNAFRYGKGRPEIIVSDNTIRIINQGTPLKKAFDAYLKPFNRTYESSADVSGLGLGLYITDSIIKTHGLILSHSYEPETSRHIFQISQAVTLR